MSFWWFVIFILLDIHVAGDHEYVVRGVVERKFGIAERKSGKWKWKWN